MEPVDARRRARHGEVELAWAAFRGRSDHRVTDGQWRDEHGLVEEPTVANRRAPNTRRARANI